jgi:hypothetical protein
VLIWDDRSLDEVSRIRGGGVVPAMLVSFNFLAMFLS